MKLYWKYENRNKTFMHPINPEAEIPAVLMFAATSLAHLDV